MTLVGKPHSTLSGELCGRARGVMTRTLGACRGLSGGAWSGLVRD